MSPGLTGGIAGLFLGIVSYAAIRFVARRVESNPKVKDGPRVARILRRAALAVLLIDIVIGYMVGPLVLVETAG